MPHILKSNFLVLLDIFHAVEVEPSKRIAKEKVSKGHGPVHITCIEHGPTFDKCSAVADMVTIDMGRKMGDRAPFWGAGSPSNAMWPRPRLTSVPSGILIQPAVWPQ